ncbi:MAG: DNA repair protein RecO [Oscillospiraceae bacterium]|jgi:DNA repair protein RecO (recombination protein O)|nr:DNA repair protein RecO [Oscillospiraceae bacterium]
MSHMTLNGLIVRAVEYKDADLILTVLTEREGNLTVTARGARRPRYPYAAAVQVLCCSRLTVSEYRDRLTLTEAEMVEPFSPLRRDLLSMSLAAYLADLSQTLAPEGELFRLTLTALAALCAGKRPRELIKAAFEMRALCGAGLEPAMEACGQCGKTSGTMYLLPAGGTALCASCAKRFRDTGAALLSYDADCLFAVRHISSVPIEKVFSFTASEQAVSRLAALCERYTLAQTGRMPPSLEFYLGLL